MGILVRLLRRKPKPVTLRREIIPIGECIAIPPPSTAQLTLPGIQQEGREAAATAIND